MEKVKVRNNTRRSLLIKVPGEALHLQPGNAAEVPRAYLTTNELATLIQSGAVLLVETPRIAVARGPGETRTEDAPMDTVPARPRRR